MNEFEKLRFQKPEYKEQSNQKPLGVKPPEDFTHMEYTTRQGVGRWGPWMEYVASDPWIQWWQPIEFEPPRTNERMAKWMRSLQLLVLVTGFRCFPPKTTAEALDKHQQVHEKHRMELARSFAPLSTPGLRSQSATPTRQVYTWRTSSMGGLLADTAEVRRKRVEEWSTDRAPSQLPSPDAGIVGEASGMVWDKPAEFGIRDVKATRALWLTDSGGAVYGQWGRTDVEYALEQLGWHNITFEDQGGKGSSSWVDLLKAYIKIHEHLLIIDGKGGLQFPAHFVLVLHENLNDLWKTKDAKQEGGSVKPAWQINDEKIEFFGTSSAR